MRGFQPPLWAAASESPKTQDLNPVKPKSKDTPRAAAPPRRLKGRILGTGKIVKRKGLLSFGFQIRITHLDVNLGVYQVNKSKECIDQYPIQGSNPQSSLILKNKIPSKPHYYWIVAVSICIPDCQSSARF